MLRLIFFLTGYFLLFNLFGQTAESDTILLGKLKRKEIEQNCNWYQSRYDAYRVNEKYIDKIRKKEGHLTFVVILGTWCSDSKEHIPAFFKVADLLGLTEADMAIYGVNRKKERVWPAAVKDLQIEAVPTIIVYKDGIEIGRIVEDTKKSIEQDLWMMVKQ